MTEVLIPNLGEAGTEATLRAWRVLDGSPVHAGQVIAEVETDKANFEVEAEVSGILHLRARTGERVPVGYCIAVIVSSETFADAVWPPAPTILPTTQEGPLLTLTTEEVELMRTAPLHAGLACLMLVLSGVLVWLVATSFLQWLPTFSGIFTLALGLLVGVPFAYAGGYAGMAIRGFWIRRLVVSGRRRLRERYEG